MSEELFIGIDLGTSNLCVSIYQKNKLKIIPNELGERITPACLAFTDTERIFGQPAINQAKINPLNTIYDVKRFINFNNLSNISRNSNWAFEISHHNDDKNIQIKVTYKNENKKFHPVEILAMILSKLKESAEKQLDGKIEKVVISVPANFDSDQRQSIIDAATIAELNHVRLISNSAAIGLAYNFYNYNESKNRNILIYDLGGSTFETSIINISNDGNVEIKALGGDNQLGGINFDEQMVNHFMKLIRDKYEIDTLSKDIVALQKVKFICNQAKLRLSSAMKTSIEITLSDKIDFQTDFSRSDFEEMNSELFDSTICIVEKMLNDFNFKKTDIHDILLLGGSTRIPKIHFLLETFFNGKNLNKSLNPDETVANGAALQAAILNRSCSDSLKNMNVIEIWPSTIISKSNNVSNNIFAPFELIPRTKTVVVELKKKPFPIEIYQGSNHLLGYYDYERKNPSSKSMLVRCRKLLSNNNITIEYKIDENAIFSTQVTQKNNEKKIVYNDGVNKRFSDLQINDMLKINKKLNFEDGQRDRAETLKNDLENFCLKVKSKLSDDFSDEVKKDICSCCDDILIKLNEIELSPENVYKQYKQSILLHLKKYQIEIK